MICVILKHYYILAEKIIFWHYLQVPTKQDTPLIKGLSSFRDKLLTERESWFVLYVML